MLNRKAIDPTKITKYNQSTNELQEFLLFWICAAGKNGVTSAKCLDNFLTYWWLNFNNVWLSPFEIIQKVNELGILSSELKKFGIGCYTKKAEFFLSLINANLDLRTCTVSDLESIKGIGPKTARCFLIHSREKQNYAGLDRHILNFLRDKGHNVPKSTPTKKIYGQLEKIFLEYVRESGKTVAELDLEIWNEYREKKHI